MLGPTVGTALVGSVVLEPKDGDSVMLHGGGTPGAMQLHEPSSSTADAS